MQSALYCRNMHIIINVHNINVNMDQRKRNHSASADQVEYTPKSTNKTPSIRHVHRDGTEFSIIFQSIKGNQFFRRRREKKISTYIFLKSFIQQSLSTVKLCDLSTQRQMLLSCGVLSALTHPPTLKAKTKNKNKIYPTNQRYTAFVNKRGPVGCKHCSTITTH